MLDGGGIKMSMEFLELITYWLSSVLILVVMIVMMTIVRKKQQSIQYKEWNRVAWLIVTTMFLLILLPNAIKQPLAMYATPLLRLIVSWFFVACWIIFLSCFAWILIRQKQESAKRAKLFLFFSSVFYTLVELFITIKETLTIF